MLIIHDFSISHSILTFPITVILDAYFNQNELIKFIIHIDKL